MPERDWPRLLPSTCYVSSKLPMSLIETIKKTLKIKASITTTVSFSDSKSHAGKPHGMLENNLMKVPSGILEQTWRSTTCNKQYLQRGVNDKN
jgi:hypothetical protein